MNIRTEFENACARKNLSIRTERSYWHQIKRFGYWCKKYPNTDRQQRIIDYLTHLAKNRQLSPSSQSIALNAIKFLYSDVLNEKWATCRNSSDQPAPSECPRYYHARTPCA